MLCFPVTIPWGEEAVFTCPSCNHHKKKLTLNLSTQKFQCWVCGYKGHRAFKLLKQVKASPKAYELLKEIDHQYSFKKQITTKEPVGIFVVICFLKLY